MSWQQIPYIVPLIIAAVISTALGYYTWRRRTASGAKPFVVLMLAVAGWSLGYALELGSVALSTKIFWAKAEYLGIVIVPVAWLAFALQYTQRGRWLTRRNLALAVIVPVITVLLAWTNEAHGLIWRRTWLESYGAFSVLGVSHGAWFWGYVAYSYLLLLLGTLLLAEALVRSTQPYRGQVAAVLIGALLPWVGNALYVSGLNPFAPVDPSPFAFALTGLTVTISLFRFQLFNLAPMARNAAMETVEEAVIALDAQQRVVDLNPAAQKLIGAKASQVVGQPLAQTFFACSSLIERHRDLAEVHEELVVGEKGERRYFDLRVSPLLGRGGQPIGRLAVLQEITARKLAEEARASKELLEKTLHSLRDAIFILDAATTQIMDCNSAASEIFGYSREEMLGRPTLFLHVDEATLEEFRRHLYPAIEEKGFLHTFEFRMKRKDGSIFPTEHCVTPLVDEEGKRTGWVSVVRDITARKQAEEALRESEARFRSLVTGASDVIVLTDLSGNILFINDAAKALYGRENLDEVIGKSAFAFIAPESVEVARQGMEVVLQKGVIRDWEYQVVRANGELVPVAMTVTLIRDAGGNPHRFMAIVHDITERKRAEEALREAEQEKALILDNMSELVTYLDREHQLLWANRAAVAAVGLATQDVVGRRCYEAWHQRSQPCPGCPVTVARETGQPQEREMATPDGRAWFVRAYPVGDGDGNVTGVVEVTLDITERKRTEKEIKRLKEFNERVVQNMAESIVMEDAEGYMTFVNPAAESLLGYKPTELLGQHWTVIIPPDQQAIVQAADERRMHGETDSYELEVIRKDGTRAPVLVGGSPWFEDGRFAGTLAVLTELSAHKRQEEEKGKLETQLRQAQRMEAVALLAGGVAHEFNNLLTVIQGNVELSLMQLDPSQRLHKQLSAVERAARRGAILTRQLLSFSRRQVLDLNALITDFGQMVKPVIGEHIELQMNLASKMRLVSADATALEQVLMNLVLNARDAMPQGGKLTMETAQVTLDEAYCRIRPNAKPGEYIRMTVADTGVGMDETVQARLFEPFFTTKEVGKGTGLGLPVVYGIVTQHNGFIEVESQPGRGARFDVYLPVRQGSMEEEEKAPPSAVQRGTETILLAEDEDLVRELGQTILERLGYTILVAADGAQAVEVFTANQERIDLVVMDVVMPKISGQKAYEAMSALQPGLPVLFITGYAAMVDPSLLPQADSQVLQKPFGTAQLGHVVRQVLDEKREK